MNVRFACTLVIAAALVTGIAGCRGDEPYQAKPAYSGRKVTLPAVPTLPQKNRKQGDAYTVWGVSHDLRSRAHIDEVNGKQISIIGYVVSTNYAGLPACRPGETANCVPLCAVHKTGKADAADCKSSVPSFSIADQKEEKKDVIQVMGWASNFAQIFSMIQGIDGAPSGKEGEVKLTDEFWSQEVPNPIPNVGAKVKVTGTYGVTFTKSTAGAAADPKHGIMTAEKIEYLEPPPERAYLPGMKKKL